MAAGEEGGVFGAEVVVLFETSLELVGMFPLVWKKRWRMGRRTSLGIFYVPDLRRRGDRCCTVLLYVLQEIDEVLFGLVWFDE